MAAQQRKIENIYELMSTFESILNQTQQTLKEVRNLM